MNYFKNTNNQIFAYDDEQIEQGYGKDLTPITEQEKDELLAPTPEQLEEQRIAKAKEAKQLALDTITVEVDGMVFDGRDKDQARMMAAIQASEILNINKTEWKLADDTVATVNVDILRLVLAASIQEVGRIVKGE